VRLFVEGRIRLSESKSIMLRLEGFNLFNHANMLPVAALLFMATGPRQRRPSASLLAVGTSDQRDSRIREY
jgi:hypothetical protein